MKLEPGCCNELNQTRDSEQFDNSLELLRRTAEVEVYRCVWCTCLLAYREGRFSRIQVLHYPARGVI